MMGDRRNLFFNFFLPFFASFFFRCPDLATPDCWTERDPRNLPQGMIHMVFQYFYPNPPTCFFFWCEKVFLTWKTFFQRENIKNSQIPTCENIFMLIWCERVFHAWLSSFAVNRITFIGPYLAPIFLRASFEVHKFANFCPLTMLDS